MIAAVIWLVLWVVATFVIPGFLAGMGNVFVVLGADERNTWIGIGGLLLWLGAVAFFIFSAVQAVLQVISVIQLI